jgi:hypothetical protein
MTPVKYATPQKLFNKVCRHLTRQRKQAVDGSACRYRAADGTTCAVGCLIADEVYTPELEGKVANQDYVVAALRESGVCVDTTTVALLRALQTVHDRKNPRRWRHALRGVAAMYNLQIPSCIDIKRKR